MNSQRFIARGFYSSSRTLKRVAWATFMVCGWYAVLRAAGEPPSSDPRPPVRPGANASSADLPSPLLSAGEISASAPDDSAVVTPLCPPHCACQSSATESDSEEPSTLLGDFGEHHVDGTFEHMLGWKEEHEIPVKVGAWHWFHESLTTSDDGYGIGGLRGTYWWEVIADLEHDLGGGQAVGAHVNYRLRDGDPFRSFFTSNFWSYEAYGYFQDDRWGTFKAGQIWRRFGLDWDGVFFGNVPYFDGFKLNPDYGLSWETTTDIHPHFHVDSFAQFYFHEDGVNGSFGGGDSESAPGFNRRNTANVRLIPTWTLGEETTLALGVSGMVGEIRSRRPTVGDQVHSAWALDATYTRGPWKVFGEALQSYGVIHPVRYVSGGPSNRLTDFLLGTHYTVGPVTYRISYSHGIDDNPHAQQTMLLAGTTINLTEHVDFYLEYVNQQVHGNAGEEHIEFFNSLEFIVYWQY